VGAELGADGGRGRSAEDVGNVAWDSHIYPPATAKNRAKPIKKSRHSRRREGLGTTGRQGWGMGGTGSIYGRHSEHRASWYYGGKIAVIICWQRFCNCRRRSTMQFKNRNLRVYVGILYRKMLRCRRSSIQ
jgi:hypothetical protein